MLRDDTGGTMVDLEESGQFLYTHKKSDGDGQSPMATGERRARGAVSGARQPTGKRVQREMGEAQAGRVLVVSDRRAVRQQLLAILDHLGAHAVGVGDVAQAVARNAEHRADIVVLDAALIPGDGGDWVDDLRRRLADPTVVGALADPDGPSVAALLADGVDAVLRTPPAVADVERFLQLGRVLVPKSEASQRRRLRRMNAVRQLALSVLDLAEAEERLPEALEVGRRLLGARGLSIWLLVEAEDRLRALAATGVPDEFLRHVEERSAGRGRAMVEMAVREHHEPLRYTGVDDPRRVSEPGTAAAAGIELTIIVPIRHASALSGLLSVYYGAADDYDPMDLPIVDALAAALAATLSTMRLRRELAITEQLYRELVEGLPIGVLLCDAAGQIQLVNAALSDLTGRSASDLVGQPLASLFFNPEAIPWDDWRVAADTPSAPVVLHFCGPAGRRLTTACRARTLALPGGAGAAPASYLQVAVEDITVQHRRLHELQLLHDLSQLIARGGDADIAFQLVAERMVMALGYRHVALATLATDGAHLERRAERGPVPCRTGRWGIDQGITGRAFRENRSILVEDVRADPDYMETDSEIRSELVAVIRSAGRPVGVLNIETDTSHPLDEQDVALAEGIAVHLGLLLDQMEFTERLEEQARTDPATGIANRRVLVERLQSLSSDQRVASAALFLIDMDRFKQVNDRYGHLVGDAVLVQVVRRLAGSLRPDDLLARYAGDELAVVLRNVDLDTALEVAERLRRTVAEPLFEHGDAVLPLTISVGVAMYPLQGTTPDDLLAAADRAMYGAKLRGGNAVHSGLAAG